MLTPTLQDNQRERVMQDYRANFDHKIIDSISHRFLSLDPVDEEEHHLSERVMQAYTANQKHIKSIYRRYLSLDPAYEEADLEQEALFATYLAMLKWDFSRSTTHKPSRTHKKDGNMDFSSFLHWYVQKHFQKCFPGDDKTVDVYDAQGRWIRAIKYNTYRKCKTALKNQGHEAHIRSILVSDENPDDTESRRVT